MEMIYNLLADGIETLDPSLKKSVRTLSNRMAAYIHVPGDEKDMLRMEKFAKQPGLPEYVIDILKQPSGFYEVLDNIPANYDIVRWWYCIALLLLSETADANTFLEELLDNMLRMNHPDLALYRRLIMLMQSNHVDHLKKKIREYFADILSSLGAYAWAKDAGVELPETEWQIRVYLPAAYDEKGRKYELKVTMWSPRGKQKTYWIEFSISPANGRPTDRVTSIWSEREVSDGTQIFVKELPKGGLGAFFNKDIPLKTRPEPVHLGELLDELEQRYGIEFTRVPERIETNVKNSRKLIGEWFKRLAKKEI